MAARIKHHALRFEQQSLALRLGQDHPTGGNPAARIDDPVPRDVSLVVRGRVHSPSHKPRAVTLLEQTGDLTVGHHAPAGYPQYQPVDPFKYFFKSRGWRNWLGPSSYLPVAGLPFLG